MRNISRVGGRWALRVIAVLFAALFIAAPMTTVYAADYPLTFDVTQTFTTNSTGVNSTFTYRLMPHADEPNNPMPSGSSPITGFTFTLTGSVTRPITIVYNQPGVYRYDLYQVIDVEMPGYVYDEKNLFLFVYIYNDPSNPSTPYMKLIIKNKDGSKVEEIEFENSYGYVPTNPNLMPDYSVVKTVTGNPDNPSQFTFKLEAQNASNPMPAGSNNGVKTVTLTGAGSTSFGKWSYTQPGTYYYTVSEVIPYPGETEYTYDQVTYKITDTVTDASGSLSLSRVVTNAANNVVASFTFINKYTRPGGPTPPVGPGTGDGMNPSFYATIFTISGALAVGAAIYLIFGGKRKKTYRRYENL